MTYAHVGWLFEKHASFATYAPDLLRDPVPVRMSRR